MNRSLPLLAAFLAACAANGGAAPVAARTPRAQEVALEDVFARVQTSVVTLRTRATRTDPVGPAIPVIEEGVGSGTLISAEGRILTAAHVVQVADAVEVVFFDGTVLPATVESSDPLTDLALVQLMGNPPAGVSPAPLGDSAAARIGSRVFVVGAPLGISHTLTAGILSARRQAPSLVGDPALVEVFQTDAAVNPGNSGGPLFDLQGQVIGVVSYIVSATGGSEGLGFAVTAACVRERLLERLPMWSGMEFVPLVGPTAELFHLPNGQSGLLVQNVAKDSPAQRLGLRGGQVGAVIGGVPLLLGGDVILEVLGEPLDLAQGTAEARAKLVALGDDDELSVRVLRGGSRVTLRARWGDLR